MNKEKEIEHIRGKYLIIVAIIALIGTLATIYKGQPKGTEAAKPEISNPAPVVEKSEPIKPIEQDKSKNGKDDVKANQTPNPVIKSDKNKTEINESKGITITIKDNETENPIAGVHVSLIDYPKSFQTDENGNFTIPQAIIDKNGTFNTIKATFVKKGYKTEHPNVALSESHSLTLNKSQ